MDFLISPVDLLVVLSLTLKIVLIGLLLVRLICLQFYQLQLLAIVFFLLSCHLFLKSVFAEIFSYELIRFFVPFSLPDLRMGVLLLLRLYITLKDLRYVDMLIKDLAICFSVRGHQFSRLFGKFVPFCVFCFVRH